jgi:hypothetical protein
MSSLRDKVYEDLDYLSQLTEVVIAPQNEVLGSIPDRTELTLEMIEAVMEYTFTHLHSYQLPLEILLQEMVPGRDLSVIRQIAENFHFEVTPNFELDLVNKTMTGSIAIVKNKQQIDDKKLLHFAVKAAENLLEPYAWPNKGLKYRAITVLNILEEGHGKEWGKKAEGRIVGQSHYAIATLLSSVILENKWRVRDATVIAKIGRWINEYMTKGDTDKTALVNLTKLKFMIARDLPIYSIEEVQRVNPT